MVVVVAAGAAVVVVVVGAGAVVSVTGGGSVVVVSIGAAVVLGTVTAVVVVVVAAGAADVSGGTVAAAVVGSPIATGVSTTRSRMPATAVDAITIESTVAPSHAAPMPKYLLIQPSMHQGGPPCVKPRLKHNERTHFVGTLGLARCKFL